MFFNGEQQGFMSTYFGQLVSQSRIRERLGTRIGDPVIRDHTLMMRRDALQWVRSVV